MIEHILAFLDRRTVGETIIIALGIGSWVAIGAKLFVAIIKVI